MNDVIEQARRLADLIASHERTKAFRDAAAAVEADPEARRAQATYASAMESLHRAEAEGRPIEPEQKRAAAKAAEDVGRSPVLVRLIRAHAEYMEMMEAVQHVLSGAPPEEEEAEPGEGHCGDHKCTCGHGSGEETHGHEHEEEPPAKGPILWTP